MDISIVPLDASVNYCNSPRLRLTALYYQDFCVVGWYFLSVLPVNILNVDGADPTLRLSGNLPHTTARHRTLINRRVRVRDSIMPLSTAGLDSAVLFARTAARITITWTADNTRDHGGRSKGFDDVEGQHARSWRSFEGFRRRRRAALNCVWSHFRVAFAGQPATAILHFRGEYCRHGDRHHRGDNRSVATILDLNSRNNTSLSKIRRNERFPRTVDTFSIFWLVSIRSWKSMFCPVARLRDYAPAWCFASLRWVVSTKYM